MKEIKIAKKILLTLAGVLMIGTMWAQENKATRPSPPAIATGKVNGATIKIDYSSPAVKGRQIWGALIPYDKVWRAGANEATMFETSKNLVVEGQPLAAGKYSLFATPGEKEWTIIFNSETGQWGDKEGGDANCNPAKNVLSVKVKPVKTEALSERLVYEVKNSGFVLRWEHVEVPVSIK